MYCTLILAIVGLMIGTTGPCIQSYSGLYNADPMLKHVPNAQMSNIANIFRRHYSSCCKALYCVSNVLCCV